MCNARVSDSISEVRNPGQGCGDCRLSVVSGDAVCRIKGRGLFWGNVATESFWIRNK